MEKDLPNGPWKTIFEGKWESYQVELLENPAKLVILNIHEDDHVVMILNKFFLAEGNASKLVENYAGYSTLLMKKQPGFKASYLMLSTGPKAVEKEFIEDEAGKLIDKIEKASEELYSLSKAYTVELVDLKHADSKYWVKLFEEPIIMIAMISGKEKKIVSGRKEVVLGIKTNGEKALEPVSSFLRTVVVGKDYRIRMLKVIVESLVMTGVNAVVFDEEDNFSGMNIPNTDFDYSTYPELQPIGMPVKELTAEEIKIDLRLLDSVMFRELIKIKKKEGEYVGKEAAELIDGIIEKRPKTLEEIEEQLLSVEESKRFNAYRAIRFIKLLKQKAKYFFGEGMKAKDIIPFYTKATGTIIRIKINNLPEEIKNIFIYSTLKKIKDYYTETKTVGLFKTIVLLDNAEKYTPSIPMKRSQEETCAIINDLSDYNTAYCVSSEYDVDLFEEIIDNNTIRIDVISKEEAAVKEAMSQPYRMKIRPTLTS